MSQLFLSIGDMYRLTHRLAHLLAVDQYSFGILLFQNHHQAGEEWQATMG